MINNSAKDIQGSRLPSNNEESAHEIDLNSPLGFQPDISDQLNNPDLFVTAMNAVAERKITAGHLTESPTRSHSCDLDLTLLDQTKVELHGVHYKTREPIDPGRFQAAIFHGLTIETTTSNDEVISIPLRLADGSLRILECDYAAVIAPQDHD